MDAAKRAAERPPLKTAKPRQPATSAEPVAETANLKTQTKRKSPSRDREQVNYDGVWSSDEDQSMHDAEDHGEPSSPSSSSGPSHSPAPSSSGNQHAQPAQPAQPGLVTDAAARRRKQVAKLMKTVLFSTHDTWAKSQDNTPAGWIDLYRNMLLLHGIQPDEAVMFITERQLGSNTATSMGAWIAQNFGATWAAFRAAFLQRHPGMPPTVTRYTWKKLSMANLGSYHAYLSEFNRQRALISTGPDELLETFLLGLTAELREQVEYHKGRLWKTTEFDKLVKTTTERVNSVSVNQATKLKTNATERAAPQTNKGTGSSKTNNRKRPPSEGPQTGQTGRPGRTGRNGNSNSRRPPPGNVGKSRDETLAISQWCHDKKLCKFCRAPITDHANKDCKHRQFPLPWHPPPGWNARMIKELAEKNETRQAEWAKRNGSN